MPLVTFLFWNLNKIKLKIKIMNVFNSINPTDLIGYLVMTEDGAVLASSGELENDEKTSEIFYKMINTSNR